jgi:hypothetical protein
MHTGKTNTNFTKILIAGSFITMIAAGCGSSTPYQVAESSPPAPAPVSTSGASAAESKSGGGILGVWDGTTLATCAMSLPSRCNAEQNVSITLVEEENSKIGGYYKCSYGNMDCYHLNETGKVVGAGITGNQISMRVMMRDGTSCRFSGRVSNGAVIGGYACYSGASQFEQGTWRARHSY